MEVVLSYGIFLPSLRVQLDQEMSESEHWEALLIQLELLDERQLRAAEHMQIYQKHLSKFHWLPRLVYFSVDNMAMNDVIEFHTCRM